MVQVTDAVGQRANREVFGCVRQQIPDQPLTYIQEPRIAVIARKRTDAETASHNHQWALCHAVFLCGRVTQGQVHRLKINLCLQQSKSFVDFLKVCFVWQQFIVYVTEP